MVETVGMEGSTSSIGSVRNYIESSGNERFYHGGMDCDTMKHTIEAIVKKSGCFINIHDGSAKDGIMCYIKEYALIYNGKLQKHAIKFLYDHRINTAGFKTDDVTLDIIDKLSKNNGQTQNKIIAEALKLK
jgi:hypothetical protein